MSGYREQPYEGYGSHGSTAPPGGAAQAPYGQDQYGQGAYGQAPYGQNPYGQAPYGQNPYAQGGYPAAYGAPDLGYGPPGLGRPPARKGAAIAALICNVLAALTCYGLLAVPGIVTAAIAVSKAESDPAAARKLTIWSWAIFGVSVVVAIMLLVVIVVIAVNEDPGFDYDVY